MTEKKEKKPCPATRKRFGGEKLNNGRPPMPIDADMVFKLAQSMLPIESISIILGCSRETLYARFSDILQKAREGRKQSLSVAMWSKALIEKDTKMMIWLSKQHLGYKDVIPEGATQINFNVYCKEIPHEAESSKITGTIDISRPKETD